MKGGLRGLEWLYGVGQVLCLSEWDGQPALQSGVMDRRGACPTSARRAFCGELHLVFK